MLLPMVAIMSDNALIMQLLLLLIIAYIMWEWFKKQDQALEAINKLSDPRYAVFAKEIYGEGARKYLVTTYDEFDSIYMKLSPKNRCYYELLIAGRPLKLHFDIEYDKNINKDLNGDELMVTLKLILIQY
eukprot:277273_1